MRADAVMTSILVFFFQAEDGIRDKLVTGVQTCALPICLFRRLFLEYLLTAFDAGKLVFFSSLEPLRERRAFLQYLAPTRETERSEERRVGKECRSRWSPDD